MRSYRGLLKRLTGVFYSALLLASVAWAEPPLRVWVQFPEAYQPAVGGGKNAWPLVSLANLERQLPVRFDVFYALAGQEYYRAGRHSGDKAAQQNYFEKLSQASAKWLKNRADAALVMGRGPQAGVEPLIREYVQAGGVLIWTAPPDKRFSDWLPVDFDVESSPSKEENLANDKNLFLGCPLDQVSAQQLPAFASKLAPEDRVLLKTHSGRPLAILAKRAQGTILFAPGLLPIPKQDFQQWSEKDADAVWTMVWDRLFALLRGDNNRPAAEVAAELRTAEAGPSVDVVVTPRNYNGPLTVRLRSRAGRVLATATAAAGKNQTLLLPPDALPGYYTIEVHAPIASPVLLGATILQLPPELELSLQLPKDKYGFRVGEKVSLTATLQGLPQRQAKPFELVVAFQDQQGRTLEQQTLPLQSEGDKPLAQRIEWTMPDLGPRGWFFWAVAECRRGKNVVARTQLPLNRFQHYSVRKEWQWSTWTDLTRFPRSTVPAVLQLFEDAGYNTLGHGSGQADWPWCYRWGLRQYVEVPHFGGIDNLGWPKEDIETFLANQARTRWPRITHSSIPSLASYGEEPGYGPAFGATWHWKDGPAPEGANRWLRKYLRQLYQGRIDQLNQQWETDFASFEQIQLDVQYGGTGHRGREDLQRMGPLTPARNLSRYVDTHSFYHWYFRKFNHTLVQQLRKINPTSVSVMSMDNEFMTQLELVGMYVHWLYPQEWMACYLAYQRQFATDPAGFIMNWGFFDDPRINRQIFLLSLMQGAIPMSFWFDIPLQFNYDLTHSKASLQFRALRRRLEPKLGTILHPLPKYDQEIGIYLPRLDWKTSMGRPAWMLGLRGDGKGVPWMAGYGGYEQTLYSALTDSGYAPRFVQPNDFEACKIIFLPYVQSIPRQDAEALDTFVKNGGVLVATPKLATHDIHGKPEKLVPGQGLSRVFGFQAKGDFHQVYESLDAASHKAWKPEAVLKFPPDFLHPGGSPVSLQSFGYQPLVQVSPQTSVEAKYADGTPAILLHRHGQGAAIFLNLLYFWSEGNYMQQYSEPREAYRVFIQQILDYAKVPPASYFVERNSQARLHDTRVGVYPYETPDGSLTYLRLYNDWRSPDLTARLKLRDPVKQVVDVMTNEALAAVDGAKGTAFVVSMAPSQGRILALLKERLERIELQGDASVNAGATTTLSIRLVAENGKLLTQARPVQLQVHGPDGKPIQLLQRDLNLVGSTRTPLKFALSDAGDYTVTVVEGCTNVRASRRVSVTPTARGSAFPAPVADFRPSAPATLVGADRHEFIQMLDQLKSVYLNAAGDKTLLTAHLATRGDGRHPLVARLGLLPWKQWASALSDSLQAGAVLILGREDLGIEHFSGRALQPWAVGGQFEALDQLLQRPGAKLLRPAGNDDLLLITLGQGQLILYRNSPDATDGTPAAFAKWHAEFLQALHSAGMKDQGPIDPAACRSAGDIVLRDWFREKL